MKNKNISKLILTLIVLSMIFSSVSTCALADSTIIAEGLPDSVYIRPAYTHVSYVPETSENAEYVGGREDTSAVFNVGAISAGTNVTHTSGAKFSVDASDTYTFEMSVYYDGSARPAVNAMWDDSLGASVLLKVDSDGYCWYNNSGTTTKSDVKMEKKSWHKIAFTYEHTRVRYSIYVDGVMLTDMTYGFNASQAASMWFGVDSASSEGRVAYDDFKGYYGAYDPSTVLIPQLSSTSEYARIEDGNIIYEPTQFASFSELEALLEKANVESSALYTDSSLNNQSQGGIGDGYVYVITSSSGISKSYTLKLPALNVFTVTFSDSENDLAVAGYVTYDGIIPKDAIMIVVTKDESGRVEKLFASEAKEVSASPTAFEITATDSAGKKAEAFFIDGWNSRISYHAVTYKN